MVGRVGRWMRLGRSHAVRPTAGTALVVIDLRLREGQPCWHLRLSPSQPINRHTSACLPTIIDPPYSMSSASSTRQRKTGGLSATDSDGVDHSNAAPQGKAIKKTPVSQCRSSLPVLFTTQPTTQPGSDPPPSSCRTVTGRLVLAVIAVSAFYIWCVPLEPSAVLPAIPLSPQLTRPTDPRPSS